MIIVLTKMNRLLKIFSIILISSAMINGFQDQRVNNRQPSLPQYLGTVYNNQLLQHNLNINANNMNINKNDAYVDEFGQCGGLDYEGPKVCRPELICVKRSKYYAQCLTFEAASNVTTQAPQYIPEGGKCHGVQTRSPLLCVTGTACFIQTENVHGECRTQCPPGWFCNRQTLPEWAPCGGEGYVGLTQCKEGLQCIPHSRWYHECRAECPEGWKC